MLNVRWVGGTWYQCIAGATSSKGTFCKYTDGDRKYHDFSVYERGVDYHVLQEAPEQINPPDAKSTLMEVAKTTKDELTCAICKEIFTAPITIKDCMHTFCSGVGRVSQSRPRTCALTCPRVSMCHDVALSRDKCWSA